MPASATVATTGVILNLDVTPADGLRSVTARLSARFDHARVLQAVELDFRDGTVAAAAAAEHECNDPSGPNPYELGLPVHTYASPGIYSVIALVTTASCTVDDGDWGPESQADVQLSVIAP